MYHSQKDRGLAPPEVKNLRLFLTRLRARPRAGPARLTGGFTLVEMLVSIGIFSVVMVVALGALVAMSEADRKAQSLNSAVNNLSAALDSMTRSIRVGTTYHCGSSNLLPPLTAQDCPSTLTGDSYFTFMSYGGAQVTYCLSQPSVGGVITLDCNASTSCGPGNTCAILRKTSGGLISMTAPEVNILNMAFFTMGAPREVLGVPDYFQPKVTILLNGVVNVTATKQTKFNIQTSVTQRIYDIYVI